MNSCRVRRLAVVLLAMTLPLGVSAGPLIAAGDTFVGTLSSVDGTGCGEPGPGGPDSAVLEVINVSGSLFDAKLTVTDASSTTTGNLNALTGVFSGAVSGCSSPGFCPFTDTEPSSGNLTNVAGTISATSAFLSGNFTETAPVAGCSGTWTFSGSVGGGGNAVSAEAPSGTLVRRQEVAQKATGPSSVFGSTLRHLSGFGRQTLGGNLASVNLGPGGGSFAKRGLSAGEWGYPIGVWGNLGYASSENDFVSVASDSTNVHGTLGGDVTVNDWLVVGLAVGFERDDVDTPFNGGNIDSDGLTLVGYAAAFVNDRVSVDVAVGRSAVENDQFRTAGGARVTSSFDSDRTFLAGNVNYGRALGDMRFTAIGGVIWVKDESDAFTESNGTAVASSDFILGRAKLGGELSALYGAWEPFVSATYNYSFTETDQVFAAGVADPGQDSTDVLLGIGVRYFGAQGLSGTIEFTSLVGRDHVEQHSLSAVLRAEF